jgi:DNA (cytosine-5)-methyltransferase 1
MCVNSQQPRQNHKGTTVYNVDTSEALQNAIDQESGKVALPLRNLHDNTLLPPMPRRGEVDFIYGGLSLRSKTSWF